MDGSHIRFIGVGMIDDGVYSVATNGVLIAVGKAYNTTPGRVTLFNYEYGEYVRAFGEDGDAIGRIGNCAGLRFCPDNASLAVADSSSNRVSVWSVEGAWVGAVGAEGDLYGPTDVAFGPRGEFNVVDGGNHRVCVFDATVGRLEATWGQCGTGDGSFKSPKALCIQGDAMYVLDQDSARVQVFH